MQTPSREAHLVFFASELRLRGDKPIVQPHTVTPEGDVLCWNGEIFEGLDISAQENDGVKLLSSLQQTRTTEEVCDVLGGIEGPYAFVFYQHAAQRILFARDPLGRRSLLVHKPTETRPYFLLMSASVGNHPSYELQELPTDSIFCLELDGTNRGYRAALEGSLTRLPRYSSDLSTRAFAQCSPVNRTVPEDPPRVESLDCIPKFLGSTVDDLIACLSRSVDLRVRDIPRIGGTKGSPRVAVLFSGGIDSTILAFFAHQHLPLEEPIDLLNVAFENPRKIQGQAEGTNNGVKKKQQRRNGQSGSGPQTTVDVSYLVPDRVTGLKEVQELRCLCPGRTWNFVEVDVPYQEYQEARPSVEALMFPGRTVMDLSLAMALYFASRGVGTVRDQLGSAPAPYTSFARVLLNGLGSDELFGGYGRHRTAYYTGGWQAVIDELQLELDRIPTRNLGRDDRVISSHGKETRHPFLSLSVVNFVAQLPVHHKVDSRLEPGIGDKMLLRLAARKLGLIEASERKKKAMQFGSHSARMEGGDSERRGDLLVS
ncbi:hypothetical protein JAAARDRAFT_203227 [Jaapia argillacea MUCL 33604]|uniref:Asparagine synthetase domain-containing protein n=1 Tax=Jaapia argillacea MUCL 33604 TaxID=933084 RepID=A0A067Q9W2_9AGAM|nr:hypothetical protein JAAARDRAFT_203227 [Jaapia argillacea MUCL 33604]